MGVWSIYRSTVHIADIVKDYYIASTNMPASTRLKREKKLTTVNYSVLYVQVIRYMWIDRSTEGEGLVERDGGAEEEGGSYLLGDGVEPTAFSSSFFTKRPFTRIRLSAKFLRTSYFTFFVHIRCFLFSKKR